MITLNTTQVFQGQQINAAQLGVATLKVLNQTLEVTGVYGTSGAPFAASPSVAGVLQWGRDLMIAEIAPL